jgi:hypothetical protein
MLAEAVTWRTINGAIQVYGSEAGVDDFEWVTQYDEVNPCDYCDSQSGRRYRRGQFMPEIPAHPNCRCFWDVHFKLNP